MRPAAPAKAGPPNAEVNLPRTHDRLLSSFENCFRIGQYFAIPARACKRAASRSVRGLRVRSALFGSKEKEMNSPRIVRLWSIALATAFCSLCLARAHAFQASITSSPSAATAERDGAHDFDFLIGNWKAHVRRLPDRLNGSNTWDVYDGISNHKKLLDSNANFEEFDVDSPQKHLHIKAQTLRLYNPDSHQWSIYLLDLDKGQISSSPVVGQFTGNRGEFFHQEDFKGRVILVRYVWLNISPRSARMEQSFSPDGGKTWEVNWICELSRP
jgi:hypothetical protein